MLKKNLHPSTSSLGSTTASSSDLSVDQPPLSPRLSSRVPEQARRARVRRDWTPPTWEPPLSTAARGLLAVYLAGFILLWIVLFGREAIYGRSPALASTPSPCTCDRPRPAAFLTKDLGLPAQCQSPFHEEAGALPRECSRSLCNCDRPHQASFLTDDLGLPGQCQLPFNEGPVAVPLERYCNKPLSLLLQNDQELPKQ
jgi:hypothetical protein